MGDAREIGLRVLAKSSAIISAGYPRVRPPEMNMQEPAGRIFTARAPTCVRREFQKMKPTRTGAARRGGEERLFRSRRYGVEYARDRFLLARDVAADYDTGRKCQTVKRERNNERADGRHELFRRESNGENRQNRERSLILISFLESVDVSIIEAFNARNGSKTYSEHVPCDL